MIVSGRLIQGLGAALASPAALSAITSSFPEGPRRNRALAIWGAIAGGGAVAGMILGGLVTEALSWEWIFFINVPIGIGVLLISPGIVSGESGRRTMKVASIWSAPSW